MISRYALVCIKNHDIQTDGGVHIYLVLSTKHILIDSDYLYRNSDGTFTAYREGWVYSDPLLDKIKDIELSSLRDINIFLVLDTYEIHPFYSLCYNIVGCFYENELDDESYSNLLLNIQALNFGIIEDVKIYDSILRDLVSFHADKFSLEKLV